MFPRQPDDPGMTAAIRIARYVLRDLVEASASAWIYCFAIFTAKFQGSMGLIAPPDIEGPAHGALRIPKRFWAIANFSRFVRPGWKLMQVEGPGGENVGFIDPGGNNFAIVAINQSATSQTAAYNFKNRTVSVVRVFATTPNLDLQPLTVQNINPNGFTAVLPPTSVLTFEGTFFR